MQKKRACPGRHWSLARLVVTGRWLAWSSGRRVVGSPGRRLAWSPARLVVGSPGRRLAWSSARLVVGSPARLVVGSPGRRLAGSPGRLVVGSSGRRLAWSSGRRLVGSPGRRVVGSSARLKKQRSFLLNSLSRNSAHYSVLATQSQSQRANSAQARTVTRVVILHHHHHHPIVCAQYQIYLIGCAYKGGRL